MLLRVNVLFCILFFNFITMTNGSGKLEYADRLKERQIEFRIAPANIDPELIQTVIEFFEAENQHNWMKTYKSRRKIFQSIVRFDTYLKLMERSLGAWRLKRVHVLEAEVVKDRYADFFVQKLKIRFIDEVKDKKLLPPDFPQQLIDNPDGNLFGITEDTYWVKEKSAWKCIECGVRFHVPLNGRVVYE